MERLAESSCDFRLLNTGALIPSVQAGLSSGSSCSRSRGRPGADCGYRQGTEDSPEALMAAEPGSGWAPLEPGPLSRGVRGGCSTLLCERAWSCPNVGRALGTLSSVASAHACPPSSSTLCGPEAWAVRGHVRVICLQWTASRQGAGAPPEPRVASTRLEAWQAERWNLVAGAGSVWDGVGSCAELPRKKGERAGPGAGGAGRATWV